MFASLGSLFIIISVLLQWRKDFSSRLVMYLSMADFALSVICLAMCAFNYSNGNIGRHGGIACEIQSVVIWYFMEVSILWLTTISINSFKMIFNNKGLSVIQEIVANIICWGFPIITSLLPIGRIGGETYGPRNGLWCSFNEDQKKAQLINIMVYYVPCLIIIIFCYSYIIRNIYSTLGRVESNQSTDRRVKIIRRLFFFVLSYFVVWTPLVISYLYEYITQSFVSFQVEYIVHILLHLQGILNFFLFGLTTSIISKIKEGTFKCMESIGVSSSSSKKLSAFDERLSRHNSDVNVNVVMNETTFS